MNFNICFVGIFNLCLPRRLPFDTSQWDWKWFLSNCLHMFSSSSSLSRSTRCRAQWRNVYCCCRLLRCARVSIRFDCIENYFIPIKLIRFIPPSANAEIYSTTCFNQTEKSDWTNRRQFAKWPLSSLEFQVLKPILFLFSSIRLFACFRDGFEWCLNDSKSIICIFNCRYIIPFTHVSHTKKFSRENWKVGTRRQLRWSET